jgi:hypothetical protein
MPNEFSIEIHNHISHRIGELKARHDQACRDNDAAEQSYCRGQLDELAWLRDYLKEHVDLKGFTYY